LKARVAELAPRARTLRGFGELLAAFREVAANPVLTSVTLLAACVSFLVGNSYQAQMPGFAADLGHGNPGVAYSMLLAADAGGALVAGLALESHGLLAPRVKTAMLLAMLWCCALITFASTSLYPLALCALFFAGFFELSFSSMAQTLLQLNATPGFRGRAIGVYSMGSLGMRTFSGFSVGFAGALLGIHHSLALSAAVVLLIVMALLAFYVRRTSRAEAPA
jgi:MFS family permease